MPIESQGSVGNTAAKSDGSISTLRLGREADLIVSELAGRYGEATRRGEVFSLVLPAITTGVAAGNVSGAAAAASTQFALWNPVGNTKALEILKVRIGLISGTPAAGPLVHNLMLSGVPSIASVGQAVCGLAGSGQPSARYVAAAAGVTLTGGGALTPYALMNMDFSAAAFADAAGTPTTEIVDGDIVIPPGFGYVPCFGAAGTTLLFGVSVTWRETSWP